jgi:hypothetical protein
VAFDASDATSSGAMQKLSLSADQQWAAQHRWTSESHSTNEWYWTDWNNYWRNQTCIRRFIPFNILVVVKSDYWQNHTISP